MSRIKIKNRVKALLSLNQGKIPVLSAMDIPPLLFTKS